jgi:hypothetical protein
MRYLVVVACLLWSCAAPPMPANTPPSDGGELTIENRGGPAFVVRAGDIEIARIQCNDGATVIPGRDSVPPLPWDLSVVRSSDNSVVLRATVTDLPRFLFQIGDQIALGTSPVAGPPGPPCPPST